MNEIEFKRGRGVVYRATTYDTPLWVSPNSRPGRWNHPEDGTIAQYCALDVASAMAEMVRYENLREIDDARELRVSIWELRIDEGAIADYSTPERTSKQGVDWSSLLSDSWSYCQAEGRRILAEGGRGVLAPSAALPQGVALTLFGPRTEIAWKVEPSLSIQIPARHILHGAPGDGLVRATRFFGDPYPEVEPGSPDSLFNFELTWDPEHDPRQSPS
jgi:RES domain-containing protein